MRPAKKVEDLKSIVEEARELLQMIIERKYLFPGSKICDCYAISQPQIDEQNPLRYFVVNPRYKDLVKTFGGLIIVNPKIIEKEEFSGETKLEGCLSYPHQPMIKVKRSLNILVTYDIITEWKEGEFASKHVDFTRLHDLAAVVFQHEMDHLNGRSIYPRFGR